ncbi:MAG: dihydroorotase [Thermoleophilia bacterium]
MNPSLSPSGAEAYPGLPGFRLSRRPSVPPSLLLPAVRLFDPGLELERRVDLLLEGGRIASYSPSPSERAQALRRDDLEGCTVFPGFVDIHTHLRTPGFEYKEDIASGTRAAAAGGYVAVLNMANTNPVVDNGPVAAWVLDEAERSARVRVGQVGAVTLGLAGEQLAELRELEDAGVAAYSDDGRPLENADVLLQTLRYLRGRNRPLLLHLEELRLCSGGSVHEGRWSARLGLRGVPSAAETVALATALEVIRYAALEAQRQGMEPVRVHFQHLSAEGSVSLLRSAREEGLPVTAEATPHHLILTDEEVQSFEQSLKMNPPLRAESDREALVEALAEGLIACVATDHAPHAPHEKEVPFEEAPFGTIGLESAFPALNRELVGSLSLGLDRLVEAMSAGPCHVLGLPVPRLSEGSPADLCVVDLNDEWEFSREDLAGKSRNSAFLGRKVQGRIRLTLVGGSIAWDKEAESGGAGSGSDRGGAGKRGD